MELLIWAGGRMRRVCPSTGRIDGWRRRAHVVCNRKGILKKISSRPALIAACKGPRLPRDRNKKTHLFVIPQAITRQKDAYVQADSEFFQAKCNTRNPTKILLQETKENKKDARERNFRSISTEVLQECSTNNEKNQKDAEKEKLDSQPLILRSQSVQQKSNLTDDIRSKIKTNNIAPKGSQKEGEKASKTESIVSSNSFKELIIDEADISLLRRYIETHKTSIDLYRFDIDDDYKTYIFYTINPLVKIERCSRIAKMLKDHDSHITIHFAKQLGLCSVLDKKKLKATKKNREAKRIANMCLTMNSSSDTAKRLTPEQKYKIREKHRWINKSNKHKRIKRKVSSLDSDSSYGSVALFEAKKQNTRQFGCISSSEDEIIIGPTTRSANKTKDIVTLPISDSDSGNIQANTLITAQVHVNNNNVRTTRNKAVEIISTEKKTIKEEAINEKAKENDVQIKKLKEKNDVVQLDSNNDSESKRLKQDNLDKISSTSLQNDTSSKTIRNKENISKGGNNLSNNRYKLQRPFAVPKRSSVRPGREYSMLEDQAIVAWLSASPQRERLVNGNRIWRELEMDHAKLTGQTRSWHSLRNRYLRYILPGIADLALPGSQAQRLRANAALGELKTKRNQTKERRNSAFLLPPVHSAWARGRKHDKTLEDSEEPSPKRILRSSFGKTATKQQTKSPTRTTNRKRSASGSPSPTRTRNKSIKRARSRSASVSRARSSSESPKRTRSKNKSTNRDRSRNISANRARSSSESPKRVRSTNRERSTNKPSNRESSRSASPKRQHSPEKHHYIHQSRHKSGRFTRSSNKSTNRLRSQDESTNHKGSPDKTTNHKRSPIKSPDSRLLRSPRSSPSYSDLTKRFSSRKNHSTPQDSPIKTTHHKRRLFNPQRLA